jgi:hypothetical protein
MEKETNADYNLNIVLNDNQIENFNFNSSTILNQINKVVGISELKKVISTFYNLIKRIKIY